MNIMRYNEPWNFLKEFTDLLENTYKNVPTVGNKSEVERCQWFPSIDIKETDEGYEIFADVPGIQSKDMNIHIENNILTISGKREEERKNGDEKNYTRIERVCGSFLRKLTLPQDAESDHIKAAIKEGVLKINIPKCKNSHTKKIEIVDQNK